MADPTTTRRGDGSLRLRVHNDLLPELDRAEHDLANGGLAGARAHLARAREVARSLLDEPTGDGAVPGDDAVGWDTVVRAAMATVRGEVGEHVTVEAAALSGGTAPASPGVAQCLTDLLVEAGRNAAAHRRGGALVVSATWTPATTTGRTSAASGGHDGRGSVVDLMVRSTGALAHGSRGTGRGLALLRRRATSLGGHLQVVHGDDATVLVARLPAARAPSATVGPPHPSGVTDARGAADV